MNLLPYITRLSQQRLRQCSTRPLGTSWYRHAHTEVCCCFQRLAKSEQIRGRLSRVGTQGRPQVSDGLSQQSCLELQALVCLARSLQQLICHPVCLLRTCSCFWRQDILRSE